MNNYMQVLSGAHYQEALQNLQQVCMAPSGVFHGMDEAVITVVDFSSESREFVNLRFGEQWRRSRFDEDIPYAAVEWLREFKRQAYIPGRGSWITCQVHIFPDKPGEVAVFDGEILARGSDGELSPTERPASAGTLRAELLVFPRTVEHIPQWMWDVFRAQNMTPPVYNPELKTVDWDNKRRPVTENGTDLSVAPVIIDPSKEPGFFSKISAKLFGS